MVPQLSGAEALLDGGRQGRSRGRVRSIGLWQVDAALVVAVALANKTARIAWAVMLRQEQYQPKAVVA
jgi:hypothetical protein